MAARQAPPSLGFSRQEHWLEWLPFPSPMHESEKWKWSRSVMSDSSWPHGLQPTRLLRPWDFPGKSTGVGCHCLLRGTLLPSRKWLAWVLCHSWTTEPWAHPWASCRGPWTLPSFIWGSSLLRSRCDQEGRAGRECLQWGWSGVGWDTTLAP